MATDTAGMLNAGNVAEIERRGCSVVTGGGHTINHPLMSTLRITGNPVSAKLQRDTLDVDVTDIFTGTPIEVAGRRVYDEVIEVASGKMTKAEILHEDNAFAITRVGPSV